MAASTAPESLQIHYTTDSVHRGVDALVGRDVDLQQSITQMRAQLHDIATTFQDLGSEDKVCLSISVSNEQDSPILHAYALLRKRRS